MCYQAELGHVNIFLPDHGELSIVSKFYSGDGFLVWGFNIVAMLHFY